MKDKTTILGLLNQHDHKYIHIRIDTEEDFEFHKKIWDEFPSFIIGKEIATKSKKVHYHICLGTTSTQFEQLMKQQHSTLYYDLREIIKKNYKVMGPQYSISVASDSRSLQKYVLKEGDFIHKGYQDADIKNLVICSYKKDKTDIQRAFNDLDEKFLTQQLEIPEYIRSFLIIKKNYGQTWKKTYIYERLDLLRLKRDKKYLSEISDRYEQEYLMR